VRVPDDRIRELDALQQPAVTLGEERRGAVGSVYVQPDPVLGAEGADRAQIVVEAGARGTGGGDERERAPPGGPAALERRGEPVRADPLEPIDLQLDRRILSQAEDGRRPPDRVAEDRRGLLRQPCGFEGFTLPAR
jgi:hypothetical protein